MKRIAIFWAAALLSLVSCGPQAFLMDVEMRHPSKSGLDLARKSMAVVYLDNGSPADSAFNGAMASSFARSLEKDYFGGDEVIPLYRMAKGTGNYAAKDSLVRLVMETGEDVVFLFDSTEFGEMSAGENQRSTYPANSDSAYVSRVTLPFRISLYAYDSMNKRDTVLSFNGGNVIRPGVYHDGRLGPGELSERVWDYVAPAAETVGAQATGKFLSQWQKESFYIIYYEQAEWERAATLAYNYEWKEAVELWMKLYTKALDVKSQKQKRSCAAYNIGLGCFMLGQSELALRWLDRSDADQILSVTQSLRQTIQSQTR